jgi:hypothetical protein
MANLNNPSNALYLNDSTGQPVAVSTTNPMPVTPISGGVAQQVVGNVASAATDSGNPVKAGGVYNTTLPTFTNGQRGDLQISSRGALNVVLTNGSASFVNVGAVASDTAGTSTVSLATQTFNYAFDGANWSRMRVPGAGLGVLTENGPYLLGRATANAQIKGSAGFIHTVSIAPLTATPTAGLLTIYNSTTGTGTVVYSEWIFATTPGHTITLDIPCSTGIYVGFDGTLANVQVTVAYR